MEPPSVDAGKGALLRALKRDGAFVSWVPGGAIQFGQQIPPRLAGATQPITVVISAAPIRVLDGPVSSGELPPCGGRPRL